jgi:hypothetical protein
LENAVISDLPDALIQEQAYLVSCGVRCVALVGECEDTEFARLAAITRLEALSPKCECLAFAISRGTDELADCGYCRHSWVVDILTWISENHPPDLVRDSILGLLCGYSSEAIASFHDWRRIRVAPPLVVRRTNQRPGD